LHLNEDGSGKKKKKKKSVMASNGGGKMRTDRRFVYSDGPRWRTGSKRSIQSKQTVEYEPTSPLSSWPEVIEFSCKPEKAWLPGPMTKFHIKGKFMVQKTEGTGATAVTEWKEPTAADYAFATLVPNWWEMLVKSIKVYHNTREISATNEPAAVVPWLNAFIYAHMDKRAKTNLAPEPCHPAYCVTHKKDVWGNGSTAVGAKDPYLDYAPKVFKTGEISFTWIPPHLFPFWQGTNFPLDEYDSNAVPFHYCKKPVDIQIMLHSDQSRMIRVAANKTEKFKFMLTGFKLVVEEANMNPQSDRALCTPRRRYRYRGLTKICSAETINNNILMHKVRFASVDFPEGIFIFAVPKKVVGGLYSYQTDTKRDTWLPHNINEVAVYFGGKEMFHKEPNFGQIRNDVINYKLVNDYKYMPPFGLQLNEELFTPKMCKEAYSENAYPHAYINLRNMGDGERSAPMHEDGSITAQKKDLEILLKFTADGSTADATYMVYIFYTDINMEMELLPDHDASFTNPYQYRGYS
jgi:hypothetical protein